MILKSDINEWGINIYDILHNQEWLLLTFNILGSLFPLLLDFEDLNTTNLARKVSLTPTKFHHGLILILRCY